MAKWKIVPLVSSVSLGLGYFLGSNSELRSNLLGFATDKDGLSRPARPTTNDELSGPGLKHYLPLPFVSAASSLIPSDQTLTTTSPKNKLQGNHVSEIMRHGFPSLDNVRAYDNFVLAYDRRTRIAHWVLEKLTLEQTHKADNVDRSNIAFYEDTSIHSFFRATNEDFKKSGYDRGHLAAAGNHKWSQGAMEQTFILSNMAPQVGKGFNRDAWNTLEKFTRHLLKKYKTVYVCTGPLFLPRREPDGKLYVKYEVIGLNNVAVPTHFFKVLFMENEEGEKELLSFVMPNQVLPEKIDLRSYMVPIEMIERASGLLLFDKIPRGTFKKINNKKT